MNGLSSNNVKCILQDSYGFLWLGTKNGLDRYDGTIIRTFNCYDYTTNHGNNNIGALYEDRNKQLWVGTDRGIFVYNPRTDRFSQVTAADRSTGAMADNWVQTIIGDKHGNVWALLPDQGVFKYSDGKTTLYQYRENGNMKNVHPTQICVNTDGKVWMCTSSGKICKFNEKYDKFDIVLSANVPFNTICSAQNSSLFLSDYKCHIFRFTPSTGQLFPLKCKLPVSNAYLHTLECFDNELWAGTSKGIFVITPATCQVTWLTEDYTNPYSLSDNLIYSLYRSADNDAWVGTYFGGVCYMQRSKSIFNVCGIHSGLLHKKLRGIAFAQDGKLWIGSEHGEGYIYNPATDESIPAPQGNKGNMLMISRLNGNILIGYAGQGLDEVLPTGIVRKLFYIERGSDNCVYSYLKDSHGNEWVGLGWALYRRNAGEPKFHHIADTGYDWIFTMYEAHDGTIWMGTMGNGIWRYTPANGKYKKYEYRESHHNGLRSNSVSAIMEDSRGVLWFSTDRGGISRYNPETDNFTSFGMAEGLPDNTAYNILEDKNGFLWFGTNKGLVKFNPHTIEAQVFTTKDGLVSNQFNYNSALKTPDGKFYFGAIGGLISFFPDEMNNQVQIRPVYFTRLSVLGEEAVNSKYVNDGLNIAFADKIELPYDRATFTINIASPNYGIKGSVILMYKLEPIDKEWILLTENTVSFANLAPGHYKLVAKAKCNTTERTKELSVVILPPWWQSWWAYLTYTLLFTTALVMAFHIYRRFKQRQLAEEQHLYTVKKEKELYQSKVEMFTTIAHEIRTPLSLIDSPLEAIEEIGITDSRARRYLKIARQNIERLLVLTGQLLDFQKLESKYIRLAKENLDVTELVSETVERFKTIMQLNNKKMRCVLPEHPIVAWLDKEALTKIISNLLNNALKYSQGNVIVALQDSADEFSLCVTSDGPPVSGKDRQRIFEPFYQIGNTARSNSGVGIGLPLCRQLARQFGGSLELADSNGNNENTFVLRIPIDKGNIEMRQKFRLAAGSDILMDEESNQTRQETKGFTLLIVEDNEELRTFVAEQLSTTFNVITAINGKAALRKLADYDINLIVTDIMMPEMDGYELCRTVKADINISHIPIVVITAKNELQSKIEILRCGAEAYIEKPFSVKYLRQLAISMLENRRREREAFSKKPFFKVDDMQMNDVDKMFIEKVIKLIEDHIMDESFNVDAMAEKMFMSRSTLLRKIKTVFNLSTVELIRIVKLKKAAELIQEGGHLIGDICYMVGISSTSYFSKIFFKQFGITPKDFEKRVKENGRKKLIIKQIPD